MERTENSDAIESNAPSLVIQKNLPIGHQNDQNAENPGRHAGLLGHVKEFATLRAKIGTVLVPGLHDLPLAVGTMSMHGVHLQKREIGNAEASKRNESVAILRFAIHHRVLSKNDFPPSKENIPYVFP